jgi:hypothetical protein
VRGSVQWRCDYTTALDIQVDPYRRGFSRHESDFALQAHVECRAFEVRRGVRIFPKSVCLLLQDLLQSCARGGGGEWRTCAMRYDEPRLVWTRLTTTH